MLRALFVTTTYFAVASLLAKIIGVGVFVAMAGAWLPGASFRGNLMWMQTKRTVWAMIALAIFSAVWLITWSV